MQLQIRPIPNMSLTRIFALGSETKKTNYMKTKMKLIASLKIWAVIYPSITLFLFAFGEALSGLPLYQRTFLLTITLVPWIVFVGVPFVDIILKMVLSDMNKK
jgi:antibiotic biosynthesis monooxygenase (ABM) superfamily enzyme